MRPETPESKHILRRRNTNVLMRQKSKAHLLADRKKLLDDRLHATREVMKLQNEGLMKDAQKKAIKKRTTFSEVSQRVSSSIASRRKSSLQVRTSK